MTCTGDDVRDLAARVVARDGRALARALTWVESDVHRGPALVEALRVPGRAFRVGATGPPGAGKSTLVAALAVAWRQAGARVGVLAVDPSSPFHGGALLGDRIRMQALSGDTDVFIRSLATRGALGGLASAVHDAADVLEAAGFDPILIETVGVGQSEVEVTRAADVTVVVLAPGSGDVIQGMKAGLLEAADVLVVNQDDRDGADALVHALESALELRAIQPPPVLRTVATVGRGVEALRDALVARGPGSAAPEVVAERRRARAAARITAAVDASRAREFWRRAGALREDLADQVVAGRLGLAEAIARLAPDEAGTEAP
ncbi:MAG: methylmalonyl Co-A mutase-associated GTPase MeaB [Planctomycetes bacterium]|nr:methylmalonyl Co-A mutase-associated GTPase MeaB [Planctomycetota bacterium]MCB9902679.1 methylmalonyl Co-A mutase-associated GTPase MeaB [Planctomycetota bacterium]